jgi:hypothetical protein
MDGIFWLVIAILFSVFQCRKIWSDRRRVLEVWLRNLLGIAVGVRYVVAVGVSATALGMESLQPIAIGEAITILSTFFALGVAGLLCLYRKIFWFGLSIVVPLRSIPIGIVNMIYIPFTLDAADELAYVSINELLVPGAILLLMGYYYFQYVRVAR